MRPIQPLIHALFLILAVIVSLPILAEERRFGKVDPEILAMTVASEDTSASAVKLFDLGEMHVRGSGGVGLEIKRHFRIKILKPSGLSEADVVIPFWHEDRVFGIEAVCISPSGRKNKLQDKSIHEELVGERFRHKTFAVPGAEVGSVIDVKYELNSNHVLSLDDWEFQDDIPVRESAVQLSIDPGFIYSVVILHDTFRRLQSIEQPYIDAAHPGMNLIRYLYRAESLPAVHEEPYVACLRDHRACIAFQIIRYRDAYEDFRFIKDPETLCRELTDGTFGKFFKPSRRVQSAVEALVGSGDSDAGKIRRLYEEVRDGFEDDPMTGDFEPRREMDEILEQRRASVSERNLLLLSMLLAAGLDAKPVLVSTRGHGKADPKVPLLSQYNRVIVRVSSGTRNWLLDAGHRFLPFGQVPAEDLSDEGLQVTREAYEIIRIPNSGLKRVEEIDARIRAVTPESGQKWTGNGRWTGTGYASEDAGRGLDEKKNIRLWIENRFVGDLEGFRITSADTLRKPSAVDTFRTEFDFEIDPPIEAVGGEWALRPFSFTRMRSNPFRSEHREFPVEFGFLSSRTERIVFEFPAGTALVSVPRDRSVGNEDAAVVYRYAVLGTSPLTVSCSRLFTVKAVSIPENRYPALRNLFGTVIDADLEPVLIRPPSTRED